MGFLEGFRCWVFGPQALMGLVEVAEAHAGQRLWVSEPYPPIIKSINMGVVKCYCDEW